MLSEPSSIKNGHNNDIVSLEEEVCSIIVSRLHSPTQTLAFTTKLLPKIPPCTLALSLSFSLGVTLLLPCQAIRWTLLAMIDSTTEFINAQTLLLQPIPRPREKLAVFTGSWRVILLKRSTTRIECYNRLVLKGRIRIIELWNLFNPDEVKRVPSLIPLNHCVRLKFDASLDNLCNERILALDANGAMLFQIVAKAKFAFGSALVLRR